jgi:hypothetical protein
MVESVAHQCLVANDHFREVFLQRTAATLTNRLLIALLPLVENISLHAVDSFEDEVAGIFLSALEIKTLGLTPKHKFELIWPSRNAEFNSDSMTEETLTNRANGLDLCNHENKKVILALVPGLMVYKCERKLVDYRNFTYGCENRLDKGDLIVRARVLTEYVV